MHRTVHGCILAAILLAAASLTGCNFDNVTIVREGNPASVKPVGRVWTVNGPDPLANAALLAKLQVPIASPIAFDGVALRDAIAYYRRTYDMNIYVRWSALAVAGIGPDTPVELDLRSTTVATALDFTLADACGGLRLIRGVPRDRLLMISTIHDLNTRTFLRIYDVRDLLAPPAGAETDTLADREERTQMLLGLLRDTVDRECWGAHGGTVGTIAAFGDKLVVQQTFENHQLLHQLLEALRERMPTVPPANAGKARIGRVWTVNEVSPAANTKLQATMARRLPEVNLKSVPILDAIRTLADLGQTSVWVNRGALKEAGIDEASPITVQVKDVTFAHALRLVLDATPAGTGLLRWAAHDGVITISTPNDTVFGKVIRIYDIRDLLEGIPNVPRPGAKPPPPPSSSSGRSRPSAGLSGASEPSPIPTQREDFLNSLAHLLTGAVGSGSWQREGGHLGEFRYYKGKLVITQIRTNHDAIQALLAALRERTPLLTPASPAKGE